MHTNADLECRITRIERENRRLRLLGLVLLATALSACVALNATPGTQTLTAERLLIVDANGETVIELGAVEGGYGLQLRDGDGRVRVSLHDNAEETGLFVRDQAGDSRVGMAHFAHGGSGFALHGEGLRGAAVLYYKKKGALSFYSEDGEVTARFPVRRDSND